MSSRTFRGWSLIALLTLLAGALSGCGPVSFAQAQEPTTVVPTVASAGGVTVEGRVVPARFAMLGFAAGGELAGLPVSEGQDVQQGDLLASLGKREAAEAAISAAELELLSARQAYEDLQDKGDLSKTGANQALVAARKAVIDAQQALDDLDTDDFRADLDDKNVAVDEAKDALDDAQENFDKYQDLNEDNNLRTKVEDDLEEAQTKYDDAVRERDLLENQLDQAQAALDQAQANLEDAQRAYADQQSGLDPDQQALAQARIDAAEAQLAAARRALQNMDLLAPYAGTVVDRHGLEVGESVAPGQPALTLADFSAWYVETSDLTELEVVSVEEGQSVTIVPDALPDLPLEGTVESIARSFSERSGDVLYTVRIRLLQTDPQLRWGMTTTVTFEE